MREKLTPKQAMFVIEYLKDMNGTQAAIRAGYSEKTAQEIASENLAKPIIQEAIQEQMDARAGRAMITADWVLNSMRKVAERCLQAQPVMYFDKVSKKMKQQMEIVIDENGNEKKVGVYAFDSQGANKALENLGKNLKLLTDKKEISGPDNQPLPMMQPIFVSAPPIIPKSEEPKQETNPDVSSP